MIRLRHVGPTDTLIIDASLEPKASLRMVPGGEKFVVPAVFDSLDLSKVSFYDKIATN